MDGIKKWIEEHPTLANIVNILVQAVISYPAMKFWVMPDKKQEHMRLHGKLNQAQMGRTAFGCAACFLDSRRQ